MNIEFPRKEGHSMREDIEFNSDGPGTVRIQNLQGVMYAVFKRDPKGHLYCVRHEGANENTLKRWSGLAQDAFEQRHVA
jgi:hypothetical protein